MFQHYGNNVRLRDRLSRSDWQGMIFVSVTSEQFRDEFVSRHLAHGGEHTGIAHSASGDLGLHHLLALSCKRVGLRLDVHGRRRWRSLTSLVRPDDSAN